MASFFHTTKQSHGVHHNGQLEIISWSWYFLGLVMWLKLEWSTKRVLTAWKTSVSLGCCRV